MPNRNDCDSLTNHRCRPGVLLILLCLSSPLIKASRRQWEVSTSDPVALSSSDKSDSCRSITPSFPLGNITLSCWAGGWTIIPRKAQRRVRSTVASGSSFLVTLRYDDNFADHLAPLPSVPPPSAANSETRIDGFFFKPTHNPISFSRRNQPSTKPKIIPIPPLASPGRCEKYKFLTTTIRLASRPSLTGLRASNTARRR